MMTKNDFEKKQCIYIFTVEGERVSFRNDNILVMNGEGVVVHQSSCYRIFAIFIIGHTTITTGIIQKSQKFGFPIYIMSPSFRTIDAIGHSVEGNCRLRQLQYAYHELELAKHIVANKIRNQRAILELQRTNDWKLRECALNLSELEDSVSDYKGDFRGLMGIEGTASRMYFKRNFDNVDWNGRKPRIKCDMVNSTLDIGYILLFNFVDALLGLYGFDTYLGIYHREFYLRKSLVCDMVEPFRPLIDWQIRKSINLGQIKEAHFNVVDGRWLLDIRNNKDYLKFLIKPLMENKVTMFLYFQSYYRAFMRSYEAERFPVFEIGGSKRF